MMKTRTIACAICAALSVFGFAAVQLYAFQLSPASGINETGQYIVNLVNTQSGATRSLQSSETTWKYTLSIAAPCTFNLTEERQTSSNTEDNGSTAPKRETIH